MTLARTSSVCMSWTGAPGRKGQLVVGLAALVKGAAEIVSNHICLESAYLPPQMGTTSSRQNHFMHCPGVPALVY